MSHTNLGDPKKRIKATISKMKLNKYLDRDFRKLSDGEEDGLSWQFQSHVIQKFFY